MVFAAQTSELQGQFNSLLIRFQSLIGVYGFCGGRLRRLGKKWISGFNP